MLYYEIEDNLQEVTGRPASTLILVKMSRSRRSYHSSTGYER